MREFDSDRQDANPRRFGIENEDGACLEQIRVLSESFKHEVADRRGQDVRGSDLKNAGSVSVGQGQEAGEVEVVREDDVIAVERPLKNRTVRSLGISHRSPVNGLVTLLVEQADPPRG